MGVRDPQRRRGGQRAGARGHDRAHASDRAGVPLAADGSHDGRDRRTGAAYAGSLGPAAGHSGNGGRHASVWPARGRAGAAHHRRGRCRTGSRRRRRADAAGRSARRASLRGADLSAHELPRRPFALARRPLPERPGGEKDARRRRRHSHRRRRRFHVVPSRARRALPPGRSGDPARRRFATDRTKLSGRSGVRGRDHSDAPAHRRRAGRAVVGRPARRSARPSRPRI